MALRGILPFDGVPNYGTAPGNLTVLPSTPLAMSTSATPAVVTRATDGWLNVAGANTGGTSVQCGVGVFANSNNWYTFTRQSVITHGCRFKIVRTGVTPGAMFLADYSTGSTATMFNLLPWADIPGGLVLNREYYFEFTVDVPSGVIYRWIDGVAIAALNINTQLYTWIDAGNGIRISWGMPTGQTSTGQLIQNSFSIRDLVFIEKVTGTTMNARIGPQTIQALDLASFSAPWVPSSGTPLSVLNTAITNAASLTTPTVASDAVNTPSDVTLTVPALIGKINAVVLKASGNRDAGAPTSLKSKFTVSGQSTPELTTQLTPTMTHGITLLSSEVAPDGSLWTQEKLASSVLRLTPA